MIFKNWINRFEQLLLALSSIVLLVSLPITTQNKFFNFNIFSNYSIFSIIVTYICYALTWIALICNLKWLRNKWLLLIFSIMLLILTRSWISSLGLFILSLVLLRTKQIQSYLTQPWKNILAEQDMTNEELADKAKYLIVASLLIVVSFIRKHYKYFYPLGWLLFIFVSESEMIRLTFLINQHSLNLWTNSLFYFNIVLLAALVVAFWTIINNFWIAYFTVNTLYASLVLGDLIKIEIRSDAVLPADLLNGITLFDAIKMTHLIIPVLLLVMLWILGIFWFNHSYQTYKLSWILRLIGFILFGGLIGSCFFWNHQNSIANNAITTIGDIQLFQNQGWGVKRNGPLVQFMNNLDVQIMPKPADYNKETMNKIERKYRISAGEINQHRKNNINDQTVIFNLSESFSDPRRVSGVTIDKEPISNIKRLKRENTSGLMMSSGYGGGTANMEYMALTGFAQGLFSPTLATPYTQLVPFQHRPYSFARNFNDAIGIHVYSKEFYNRSTNYPKLGIKKFYYKDDENKLLIDVHDKDSYLGNGHYLSDFVAYKNTLSHISSQPKFINLITMQNHMPYKDLYDSQFKSNNADGTDENLLNNYIQGINYTDQAVNQFINKLNKIKEPVTLVFYGDHLPGFYNNDMEKDGIKLHQTDYFIYQNPAAKKLSHVGKMKQYKIVDPGDFIPLVLKQTNSKVTPYQALLTNMLDRLPANSVNPTQDGTNTFTPQARFTNGSKIESLSTKGQKQLWHDYQLVQYDQTAGYHYLNNQFYLRQ